jgi:uncharacterized Zn finger protein
MAELKCPKCGWSLTTEHATIRGHEVLIIKCKEYGHFFGVISDTAKIKAKLNEIAAQAGVIPLP